MDKWKNKVLYFEQFSDLESLKLPSWPIICHSRENGVAYLSVVQITRLKKSPPGAYLSKRFVDSCHFSRELYGFRRSGLHSFVLNM